MRQNSIISAISAFGRTLLVAAILVAAFEQSAHAQAGVVIDPTHIAETAAQGAARAEEFKAGYQNSLTTIKSLEEMLKEMGVNTKLANNRVFKAIDNNMPYLDTYMGYARELSLATQQAQHAIDLTSQLVTGKVLNYNQAMYIIKTDADNLTNLMRTYKLNKDIMNVLRNDGYNNEEKRKHIQEARDTAGYYRVFFQNQIRNLENIAATREFQNGLNSVMAKAEAHNKAIGPSAGLRGSAPTIVHGDYDYDYGKGYNYGINTYWPTKGQWKAAIDKLMNQNPIQDGKAAASEIARPKKAVLRLVEVIIAILALGYTVIAFVRVTKGEQQSQDALLKIALGLLFAAIVIVVLEAEIAPRISF